MIWMQMPCRRTYQRSTFNIYLRKEIYLHLPDDRGKHTFFSYSHFVKILVFYVRLEKSLFIDCVTRNYCEWARLIWGPLTDTIKCGEGIQQPLGNIGEGACQNGRTRYG